MDTGDFTQYFYLMNGSTINSISYVYPAIEIESISKGIVYASQVGWSDDDGRCCPSLRRDVIYNYENKMLKSIKEFEYKPSTNKQ
ncbi:MAG: hypothetical protein IPN13_18695 [Bacteroidetes bacterium]|nr:hypothetical protein [Bacteroidota bacterium]